MKKIYSLTVLLAALLLCNTSRLIANDLESDSLALVAFYFGAGGPAVADIPDTGSAWDTSGTWLKKPIANWNGIAVSKVPTGVANDSALRVTSLSTSALFLTDTISPEIGKLTAISDLRIMGDETGINGTDPRAQELHGTIPEEIWDCDSIEILQIKYTGCTKLEIPTDGLSHLKKLYELNFQQTYLNCDIPEEFFEIPSLLNLYLHQSNFTGSISSKIQNYTGLRRLYLQENHLDSVPFVDIKNKDCKIQLTGNYFSYETVLPYHQLDSINKLTDDYQYRDTIFYSKENTKLGDTLVFDLSSTNADQYAWFKNESSAPMFTTVTDSIISIDSITLADTGSYTCNLQYDNISSFVIYSTFIVSGIDTTSTDDDDDDEVSVSQQEALTFNAYPNPCNNELTIENNSVIDAFSIVDITGKTVLFSSALNEEKTTISVANLNKGLYFITISSNGTLSTHKFIKE